MIMNKKNNKWPEEVSHFVVPQTPPGFFTNPGIYHLQIKAFEEVGYETLLILYDDTDFINEIAAVQPFQFELSPFAVNTTYGPIAGFLFWVVSPSNRNEPFCLFDKPIDISKAYSLEPWKELAGQTHLHLLLLNKQQEIVDLFEFPNSFTFDEAIEIFQNLDKNRIVNYDMAENEYFDRYPLRYLYEVATNQS